MITVRQSAISAFIRYCPLQAQHQYSLGVAPLEGPTNIELALGTATHLALASAYGADVAGEDKWPVQDIVDRFIEAYDGKEVAPGEQPTTDIDYKGESPGKYRTDGIAMVQAYYQTYLKTQAKLVEHPLEKDYLVEHGGVDLREDHMRVTTRLDLVTANNWIIDLKTSAVGTRRNGSEYFYAYSEGAVQWLPQPFIHLALHGKARPYAFDVLGKGRTPLVERVPVVHSQEQVDTWEQKVLLPAIAQIARGDFPARPGSHCSWCPLAHRTECGMLGVTT